MNIDIEWIWIAGGALFVGYLLGRAARPGAAKPPAAPHVPRNQVDPIIRELLENGRKIEAIKQYRALYGVDLKQAKEAIESLEAPP